MVRLAPESGIPARELFENNPLPMWVYDLATLAFLAVNDAAVRHYGYSRREFLAMTIKEIRPPEDIPSLLEKVSRSVDGYDAAGAWRHRTKDGTIIDVEIVTHTITFAGTRAKLVLANDVTEHLRLERSFHTAAREWRKAFDAMNDCIAWIDRTGRIVRCNKALTALAKKSYQDIIGHHCEEVVFDTEVPAAGCPVKEVMTTHKRATATLTSGSQIYKISADPLFAEDGEFIGAVHIMSDVTQQERIARVLHERALQQQAILDNIPDIAWLKDDQSRFLAVNEPFVKASGLAAAGLVGKTDLDIWPRELAERYRADDREVMLSGARKTVEEPLADKEGKTAWIETIKSPIVDETGRVVGTTGIARDITARHQAEVALRRKDHVLSEAQRIAHIGSWEADLKTGKVVWSEEMHRIYGTSPETFVPTARSYIHMVHPEDRRTMIEWIRATSAGKRLESLEFRVFRPDGTERWVRGSVEPLLDATGKPIGAIGTGQDITASKQFADDLQASEKKFRTLFEAADDAIFILDMSGRFIDLNTVAHERLGYTRAEMLSRNVAEFDPPEFAARVREHIEAIRKYGKAVFESAHIRKDGTIMPVEINAVVIDHEGRKAVFSIIRDITERKKLQEEIYRISHDWEETFDTLTDMVTVHDKDFNIIRANTAAEKILGLPFLAAKNVKCFEYFHGTVCPPDGCPSCATLVTGQPSVNEIYEPHLGLHLEIRAIPRLDSNRQVVGLIHVVRDITERTRAEEAKREQRLLAEFGMHIGTALNREGSLQEVLGACTEIMVNDLGAAFARVWTMSPDENMLVLQASSGIYTHRDGPHGLIPLAANLKIPTIARTRIPHLTNSVIGDPQVNQEWAVREGMVAFAGYPLQVGARLVGVMGLFSRRQLSDFTLSALEGVANNIAAGIERILSDAAVKRYGEELAALNTASNDLLVLASLPEIYDQICRFAEKVFKVDLVWLGLVDADGSGVTIAGSAGAAGEYLRTLVVTLDDSPTGGGPTSRAIRSRQPWLARRDSPESAPWRAAAEQSGFESSLAIPLISPTAAGTCIGALNFSSRSADYFTPDRVRLCQIFANQSAIAIENARLIEGLEGKVAARTRQIEDANIELTQLNQELEQRRHEAESASRTKSDFLANMSHELRTPLNAIIGFSDLMARGMAGPLGEDQKEYVGDILAGGKHLLSLINDILDLSKIEAGRMELELSEFDLAELIDRSLVLFREKALKHRLELRAEVEDAIAPLLGDERKIRQVMYNLLSNAVKFTPDGGSVIVRVKTVQESGRDYAEISVTDTGIGISSEDQKRLFQPFGQLSHHLTKDYEGTGLGLALCRSFVEMHHGRIGVKSAPGRGSCFTFRIALRYERGAS